MRTGVLFSSLSYSLTHFAPLSTCLKPHMLSLLSSLGSQETLASNYEGTRTVLELAAAAQQLRGLVHVSSAFVNMNMPRGSIIDEAVYPLRLGRQVVDVEQIAKVGLWGGGRWQRAANAGRAGGGSGEAGPKKGKEDREGGRSRVSCSRRLQAWGAWHRGKSLRSKSGPDDCSWSG